MTAHPTTEQRQASAHGHDSASPGAPPGRATFLQALERGVGAFTLHDVLGTIVYASPAMRQLLGYPTDDLVGLHPVAQIHPDDVPAARQLFEDLATAHGATATAEYRLRHADGSWRWMRGQARNLLSDPDVRAVVLVQQDITQLRESLSSVKSAELFLEQAQELANVGSWVSGVGPGDVLAWSRQTYRIFGVREGTISRLEQFYELVHPDDRAPVLAAVGKLLDGGVYDMEHRIVRPDGKVRWVHEKADLLRDEEGRPSHIIGVVKDVSIEKQLEGDLDHLFLLSVDLLGIFDFEGQVKVVNPAWRWTLGWEPGELIGRSWPDLVVPEDREQAAQALDRLWKGTSVTELELRLRRKGEGSRRITWTMVPHRAHGRFYAVGHDVTDRRKLEAQLSQSQKMEAIGRLAGGIAHDFNNMLSVISGFARLVLDDMRPTDPSHADVSEIIAASERSAQLTRQLLAFGRRQVLEPKPTDVVAHMKQVERMLERVIGEDVRLSILPGPEAAMVMVDTTQLEQVVMNLVVNARDAMPRGGDLTIEIGEERLDEEAAQAQGGRGAGDYVVITVRDTGEGMTQAVQEHIFEPFFTTKEAGVGTGLGLATVFGIVQQSGGHIRVESVVGKGTSFHVYFPRLGEGEGPASRSPTSVFPRRGNETILLVEDESAVRRFVRKVLERSGYTVIDTGAPGDALLLAERHTGPIDLLLSDIIMPAITGPELAERIRKHRPGLRVLLMSGYSEGVFARQGLADMRSNVIQKPLTPRDLLDRVREVLDASSGNQPA